MAIHIRRECSATPDAVLEAIRAYAPERGPAHLPAVSRQGGAIRTVARTGRHSFRLRFKRNPWYDEGDNLELHGTVTSRPVGGTLLVARAGRRRGLRAFVILFSGMSLIMALAGAGAGAAWPVGIMLLGVAVLRWQDARVSYVSDPEAAYLVDRLEYAIMHVEQGSSP